MKSLVKAFKHPIFYLSLIVLIYLILLIPTLGRQGITWDEQTDINIVRHYLSQKWGILTDSPSDPTQTRLPMFIVAIVSFLFNTASLYSARLVSVFFGVLTLIAVYVFCKRFLDYRKGLVACFILATSPYFLSFSRVALTESDIFITCALSWSLVCVGILLKKRTLGWAAITGWVLGLALSSKISAISVLPAVFLALIFLSDKAKDSEYAYLSRENLLVLGLLLGICFVMIFGGWSLAFISVDLKDFRGSLQFLQAHYFLVLIFWLITLSWLFAFRKYTLKPFELALFVTLFSCLNFLVIPPAHTTNLDIFSGLTNAFFEKYVDTPGSHFREVFLLHFLSVLIKPGLFMGFFLWLSLILMIPQLKSRKEIRLPFLVFVFYFVFLVRMTVAQVFYMMPLFPFLAMFASDQFVNLSAKRRKTSLGIGIIALGMLVVDLFLCYPDYNLNGYQWVRERYIGGRSSVGAKSIVNVAHDGVEQALKWINRNVQEGKIIVNYGAPEHIVYAVCPNPEFKIIHRALPRSTLSNFGESSEELLKNSDYVITAINFDIHRGYQVGDNPSGDIYKYRYDRDMLRSNFKKVFSVKRAFDLEVASVWQRKE